jgi:hypothetical protein
VRSWSVIRPHAGAGEVCNTGSRSCMRLARSRRGRHRVGAHPVAGSHPPHPHTLPRRPSSGVQVARPGPHLHPSPGEVVALTGPRSSRHMTRRAGTDGGSAWLLAPLCRRRRQQPAPGTHSAAGSRPAPQLGATSRWSPGSRGAQGAPAAPAAVGRGATAPTGTRDGGAWCAPWRSPCRERCQRAGADGLPSARRLSRPGPAGYSGGARRGPGRPPGHRGGPWPGPTPPGHSPR